MENRKAVIIGLVAESAEATKEEIKKETTKEFSKPHPIIPWLKNIEKVIAIEN